MEELKKRTYHMTINGLDVEAVYLEDTIDNVLIPLLHKWTDLQKQLGRRIFVYLAGSPGSGKSTLGLFIENLSKQVEGVTPLQCVGMDGFHYHESYLHTHFIEGTDIPLKKIKGSPESFDAEGLYEKIKASRFENVKWPVYSRQLHDVEDDKVELTSDIVLLEGNYLLLNEDRWTPLREFMDDSVYLYTKPEYVGKRLIDRKIIGGSTVEEATTHYNNSDSKNVLRVIANSSFGNTTLWLDGEDNITLYKGEKND